MTGMTGTVLTDGKDEDEPPEAAKHASEVSQPAALTAPVPATQLVPLPSTKCVCPNDALNDALNDNKSGDMERENACVNPKHARRKHKSQEKSPELVDEDGVLVDVDVSIADQGSSREGKTADIDNFFSAAFEHTGTNGKVKKHRKKKCILVNEATTLCRHAEAHFGGKYWKWASENLFESMLPGDIKARKEKAQAAIEWLVATDQPIQALEHPKFKEMVDIASHATNRVKISGREATRAEIMRMFKNNLTRLRNTLNSTTTIKGNVNATCDTWQAGNVDGHWIEEKAPMLWEIQSSLLGFTKVNNAHNGK
ncbi:hypothetical protein BDR07DRAFT_1386546 [Suillus spraguei]|nr:hypothetical protein BDR07DRAFT_1386546 [Suillus spraguei]